MKNRNFSFYKTLYLTRKNPYELPDYRKDFFEKTKKHNDSFVNGSIELGGRYRVEVFSISNPWLLSVNDYLHFFENHKEGLIGAQVSDVDWYHLDDYVSNQAGFGISYREEDENLWVDSSKKCWIPSIDLLRIPFYFWLGFINPDWDGKNYVFLFYPFEEGTDNLYLYGTPESVDNNTIGKNEDEINEGGDIFTPYYGNPYSFENSRDRFSENYLGTASLF